MSVCIPTGAVLLSRACDASHHAPPLNCLSVALRRLESDPCTLSLASCRLEWFSQIATTVAQCHAYGLTHGQLRPEHVLLSADGQTVKLLGFDPQSWRQVRFGPNLDGQLALRPPNPHDAPELSGRTHASASELAAADMWSLGVLLTAVLVEYPPVYDHSTSLIQWPQALHAAPPALRHLLECLLHPQPSQRPLSAAVAAHAHALLRSRAQCAPMASGLELSKASAPPPPSTSSSTPLDSLRSETRCEGRCEGFSSSDLDRRLHPLAVVSREHRVARRPV
jgi:serine/threonine protein kinase